MKRPAALVFSLFLLTSVGAAITVDSPADRTHLDAAVTVQVSDADGPVEYSLNDGAREDCNCIDNPYALFAPEGTNTLTVYDSDGSTATRTFTVDTEPPNVTDRRPDGTTYTLSPQLRLKYRDVSTVDVDKMEVERNGAVVDGEAGQHWFNASLDDLSEGVHTFSYNIPDEYWETVSGHNASGTWNITLPVSPVLSDTGPTGVTDSDVTLTVDAADPSPIATSNSYIDVDGPENSRIDWEDRAEDISQTDTGARLSTDLTGLLDGEYTVTAHVEDDNGNAAEQEWTFTVDTTAPDILFQTPVTGDVVAGDERFDLNISDLTAVDQVNVSVGDDTLTADQDGEVWTASYDTSSLPDGDTTVTVQATDTAGNTATEQVSIVVDNTAPEIEVLELYPETAQGGLEISGTVRDAATDIIGARYRIKELGASETITDGRMNAVNGEFDSGEETVRQVVDLDGLDLDTGNYSAFLMTRDAAGHDAEGFGKPFYVDNSLEPALDIEETVFRQEIGTSETFSVPVANTGEVDELVSLSVEADPDTTVTPDERRIDTGETKQFNMEVELPDNASSLGTQSVTVTAEGLSTTDTLDTEIIGQPHPEGQEEIRTAFQELAEDLAELNESRQGWGLSSDGAEQFEETAERVSTVRTLLEEGRYQAAEQELAAAEDTFEQTQSTISGEITRAQLGTLASTVAKLLAVLALVGLVYGGYRLIPEEEGYNPDSGYVHRPGGKHPVRLQIEDWWRRMQAEESEPEGPKEKTVERWQGYNS